MANFTPIVDGLDWQSVDYINELILSIRERCLAAHWMYDLPQLVQPGDDIQDKDFWYSLRAPLLGVITSYLDHELVAAQGLNDALPLEPFYEMGYTVERCFEVAGMSPYGFRNATSWPADWTNLNDPAYAYGRPMLAGDIIGPWVFDDIRRLCSALKWTGRDYSAYDTTYCNGVGQAGAQQTSSDEEPCEDAIAAVVDDWDCDEGSSMSSMGQSSSSSSSSGSSGSSSSTSQSWSSQSSSGDDPDDRMAPPPAGPPVAPRGSPHAYAVGWNVYRYFGGYSAYAYRYATINMALDRFDGVPCAWECHIYSSASGNWLDIDSTGLPQDAWGLWDSATQQGTAFSAARLGGEDCPIPYDACGHVDEGEFGMRQDGSCWIFKWLFSFSDL